MSYFYFTNHGQCRIGEPAGILTSRGEGVVLETLAVFVETAGNVSITKAPHKERSAARLISFVPRRGFVVLLVDFAFCFKC